MQTKNNNQPATTSDPTLPAVKKPNIKFAGLDVWDKAKRKVIREIRPIESFQLSGQAINLPSADSQKAKRLFYHEAADQIVRSFPHLYKRVK